MLPNAGMIHQPMGGTGGGTQQMDSMAITVRTCLARKHVTDWKNLGENSGQTIKENPRWYEQDNWMTAEETLAYGFIDEIMANNNLG